MKTCMVKIYFDISFRWDPDSVGCCHGEGEDGKWAGVRSGVKGHHPRDTVVTVTTRKVPDESTTRNAENKSWNVRGC